MATFHLKIIAYDKIFYDDEAVSIVLPAVDGEIQIMANHEEYVIGNLLHESIDDIWRSSKLDRFRGITRLNDLDDCPKCQFKKQCALKNCRLKPVFEGKKFTSSVSYCKRNALEI